MWVDCYVFKMLFAKHVKYYLKILPVGREITFSSHLNSKSRKNKKLENFNLSKLPTNKLTPRKALPMKFHLIGNIIEFYLRIPKLEPRKKRIAPCERTTEWV